MLKYVFATGVVVAVATAVSVIDQKSTRVLGTSSAERSRADTAQAIYATGITEGATEAIQLRAEQFGRVREVGVRVGQWVEAGDVLIRLDDDAAAQEAALAKANLELASAELERLQNGARREEREEARANVRAATARLDQAVRNFKRIQELRSDRAVTEQEAEDQQALVDTLRANLEAAEARACQLEAPARADELRAAQARVAAAQSELNLANIRRGKFEVRAPRRGRVLDVHVEPGELTGPDAVQPLVILSDPSTIRVRAFVEELDAPRVRVGMPARVTADGLRGKSFDGTVVSISPQMAAKSLRSDHPNELYDTKTREVYLELANASDVLIGLRVDVELRLAIQH